MLQTFAVEIPALHQKALPCERRIRHRRRDFMSNIPRQSIGPSVIIHVLGFRLPDPDAA